MYQLGKYQNLCLRIFHEAYHHLPKVSTSTAMRDLIKLPTEILTAIIDNLERCYLDTDFNDGRWPVHSRRSCDDVRHVRLTCSKFRDIAWPIFARMLGDCAFTLTPLSMARLQEISIHPALCNLVEALTLSSTYLFPEACWSPYSTRPLLYLDGDDWYDALSKTLGPSEMQRYDNDALPLNQAWGQALQAQTRFWSSGEEPPSKTLSTIFASFKNLRHLRTTEGFSLSHGLLPRHKQWLQLEIGSRLSPVQKHLIDRYHVNPDTSPEQHCPQFQDTLQVALAHSGIKFDTVVESCGWGHRLKNRQYLASLRYMQKTDVLSNLRSFTLELSGLADDDNDSDESLVTAAIFNSLFSAAPHLKVLRADTPWDHLESWTSGLDKEVELEILELRCVSITKTGLMNFITPHLRSLKLHQVWLYHDEKDVHGSDIAMNGEQCSALLLEIVEKTHLQSLILEELGKVPIELKYMQLDGIASKVPLLAVRQGRNGTPLVDFMRTTIVYVDGVEVDDGEDSSGQYPWHKDNASKLGLWQGYRLDFHLGVKNGEEDARLLRVY